MGFLPRVKAVERTVILNPFRAEVAKWFSISANHCQVLEIVRVLTDDPNIIGIGETMIDYIAVPHKVTDASIEKVSGSQVSEFMFDDSIGAGLQMALLDATGKAEELPVFKLFGRTLYRDSCPVSWWNMEAPAEVLAREAQKAATEGYTTHKIKARPWFDIYQQLDAIDEVTPDNYLIDIDWNGQLLDAKRAIPVIQKLNSRAKIGLFEDPIPRDDINGQVKLRSICQRPLLTHFFEEWSDRQLQSRAVDGYVIDGGVSRILHIGTEIDKRNMEGFIQICGSGLTVALSLHLGAVIKGARQPYVSMVTSFTHELLKAALKPHSGFIEVPKGPGLGVELDEEKISLLEIKDSYPLVLPRRVYKFNLGDGRVRNYASVARLWEETSLSGSLPVQPIGSSLEIIDDDSTSDFERMYERALGAPFWD